MYPAYAASLAFFFLCAWLTTNVIKVCISFAIYYSGCSSSVLYILEPLITGLENGLEQWNGQWIG